MKFYKVITITPACGRRIAFKAQPSCKTGAWTRNIFGARQLTLEATRHEFVAYLRGRIPGAGPIRIQPADCETATRYVPNRHQRRHGINGNGFWWL